MYSGIPHFDSSAWPLFSTHSHWSGIPEPQAQYVSDRNDYLQMQNELWSRSFGRQKILQKLRKSLLKALIIGVIYKGTRGTPTFSTEGTAFPLFRTDGGELAAVAVNNRRSAGI